MLSCFPSSSENDIHLKRVFLAVSFLYERTKLYIYSKLFTRIAEHCNKATYSAVSQEETHFF